MKTRVWFGLTFALYLVQFVIGFWLGWLNAPHCPPPKPDTRIDRVCQQSETLLLLAERRASVDPDGAATIKATLEGVRRICTEVER